MLPPEYVHDGETYLQHVFDFVTSEGRVIRFYFTNQCVINYLIITPITASQRASASMVFHKWPLQVWHFRVDPASDFGLDHQFGAQLQLRFQDCRRQHFLRLLNCRLLHRDQFFVNWLGELIFRWRFFGFHYWLSISFLLLSVYFGAWCSFLLWLEDGVGG